MHAGPWRAKALAILQISRRLAALSGALGLLLWWSGAGVAGTAPRDGVSCVYDQLSPEDREIALLLFEREVAASARFQAGSRNLKVIDRLIEEARDKCAVPFGWLRGRSDAAVSYAMNELMNSGVAQALEAKGHTAAPIEAYYTKHRAELDGFDTIAGANSTAFRAYLLEQGWMKTEAPLLGLAEFYLEALLSRARQIRTFTAAPVRRAAIISAKPSRPPVRAKPARRGKP